MVLITEDVFKERLIKCKDISEYELLDQYIKMTTEIKFKHKLYGEISSITPYNFIKKKC